MPKRKGLDMIRIGVLGAAKIAPAALIAPAARRTDCAVIAVAARDPVRAAAFARKHEIAGTAASYEALIAHPGLDLIYNALPPNRHADLTIAALEAGKHLLCEKPFAMNAREAARMTDAARASGRHLIEALHYRFHPAWLDVLGKVRAGEIGRVRHIDATFCVAIPFAPGELRHTAALGGGALMDLGCYPCHWARTIAGETPRVVAAHADEGEPGIDVTIAADLAFPSGATARISASMAASVALRAELHIAGDTGAITFVNPLAPHLGHQVRIERAGESAHVYTVDGQTTYDHQLDHVMDVLAGRTQALTGGADAVANMALIDAIYVAAGMHPRGMAAPR